MSVWRFFNQEAIAMEEVAFMLIWIGQSCFWLRAGETTIVIDPVAPRVGYAAAPIEADVALVSHEHGDHNFLDMIKGDPTVLRGLSEGGAGWADIQFKNGDVKITAFPTYHDDAQGAKRGKNSMFLIETRGVRILHTGDLGHTLDPGLVEKIGRVDVLLICVGGHYTIDAAQAREVVGQFKPRVAVPMHYKTEKTPSSPIASLDAFLEGWDDVRRPDQAKAVFGASLSEYPEGKTAILALPYSEGMNPGDQ